MNAEVPSSTEERLTLRRMITDTGDIIETPIIKDAPETDQQMGIFITYFMLLMLFVSSDRPE